MSRKKSQFSSAADWRAAAMRRAGNIDDAEAGQRKAIADAHNQRQGINDADSLADQQLYIQGKMDMDEYQRYVLFKHSNP